MEHSRKVDVRTVPGVTGHLVGAVMSDRSRADNSELPVLGHGYACLLCHHSFLGRSHSPHAGSVRVRHTAAYCSARIVSAASSTARMILSYPVQRQRFPAKNSRTSCSSGSGLLSNNALEATIKPGVQTPH